MASITILASGQRVRCIWSGKVGTVLNPHMPREPGDDHPPGVLVELAPFWPRWQQSPWPICNLEVIYDPEDLIIVEPPGSRRP
jgi:hypothetical protein